ncbi:glycosyltransferase [Pseudoalteromonas sp. SG44-8]|uniref:CgeB family protein n=1 Tax=Pseudoalteromonas sp. SG44-8 TaxID=2760958 RepID=UPI00160177B7|nr:glycosyltransferase [Pseudoalteromonas sp. SG44-8]MBB1399445.1 glycosyltransferase family 1 protein [Pseudoalteromonas sp. SG44-8]
MKILIAADWHGSEIYADVFKNKFEKLGHEVICFSWKEYFKHYQYPQRYQTDGNVLKSIYFRFQNKYIFGPVIRRLNADFLRAVNKNKPDILFIYRGTHILPKTLKEIKKNNIVTIFGYNNDDPFSPKYPKYFWRHFMGGIKLYDHLFCYRKHNVDEFISAGCKSVSLLRAYYTHERNKIVSTSSSQYSCDIIFIGHFEDDGRDQYLLELLMTDFEVKIYGTGWEKSKLYKKLLLLNGPIEPLYADYNLALNSAKIALVFLSKLNRDTYTRRCFEIPAAGTLMLSEYTQDLDSIFQKGVDADYFNSCAELLEKVSFYLNNPDILQKVTDSGHARLLRDGHEAEDRVKEILERYY